MADLTVMAEAGIRALAGSPPRAPCRLHEMHALLSYMQTALIEALDRFGVSEDRSTAGDPRPSKRVWILLLLVVVAVIAGFTVHRLRGFFGSRGVLVTPKVFADDPESFDPGRW